MIRLPIGNGIEFLQTNRIHFTVGGSFLYFTMGRPLPIPKLPLPLGDPDAHLIRGYYDPPHMPNGISIGPAFLPQFIRVTNRRTSDRPWTSLAIGPGYQPSVGSLDLTRGQSNLTKGRIVTPKIRARSALTEPEVVYISVTVGRRRTGFVSCESERRGLCQENYFRLCQSTSGMDRWGDDAAFCQITLTSCCYYYNK